MSLSADARDAGPEIPFWRMASHRRDPHMWTQIVGKIRLKLSPWINHSWHVTLYLTARGLTTSPIPYGLHTFELRFDFIDHNLLILKSDGRQHAIALRPQSVAKFYRAVMAGLEALNLPVQIDLVPNELAEVIPFDRDETHHSYNPEQANRFWRVLAQAERVFTKFRGSFCGKCSPVHFFWAVSTSRSLVSPVARRRRIPAASRICPMPWPVKRMRGR